MSTMKKIVQKRLKMKDLNMEHLSQFNDLLRYAFQVTNQELVSVGWQEDEIVESKCPVLEKADVIGWFDREKLVSQVAVYPMNVNIHGEIYKMGGVTGVATYPEYANFGLMYQLILQSLKDMRKREQSISYLYPYSIPFYRHKGWEIMSDKVTFKIKDEQLPDIMEVSGMVERVDLDHEDLRVVYDRFSANRHGSLVRDQLAWEEYWRWDVEEMVAAIYYNEHHTPLGYVFYWIVEDVFYIKEIVYLNTEARKGLWNYISAHYSMITDVKGSTYTNETMAFLLEDSEIVETISPFFMARIVDVEAFLKKYPFTVKSKDIQLHFVIEDPLAEWNRGIFSLRWDEQGETVVSRDAIGYEVKLNIQTLTTMLMSYRRPSYLSRIERLSADPKAIKVLESLIPQEQPYYSDYF